jgi:hypothetical protein
MAVVSGLLPAAQGVAGFAALKRAAAELRATGDPRSEAQLMADTFVQRLTGQADPAATPVDIQLVISDQTLLGDSDEPARLAGYGPIPAPIARHLIRNLPDHITAWLGRLFTDPTTGLITGIDTTRRCFRGPLRRALIIRDEICRTRFCNGAIKHLDHVTAAADGGPTDQTNGQGLCEHCNYTKTTPGWTAEPDPIGGAGVAVTTTTPTGHTSTSRPPPLPGTPPGALPGILRPDQTWDPLWRATMEYTHPTRAA